MDENTKQIEAIHTHRAYLYQLFSVVFGSKPSLESLNTLTGEVSISVLREFLPDPSIDQALLQIEDLHHALQHDPATTLDKVSDEYTRLLVGPGNLLAPPWESAYLSCDGALFSERTLSVRAAYLKQGVLPHGYPHESDDHLALELDFMHKVAAKTLVALQEGSANEADTLLEEQQAFLQEHLLTWINSFTTDICRATTKLLYPPMSLLVSQFLQEDALILKELLPSSFSR